jgi:putative oxidoreductase
MLQLHFRQMRVLGPIYAWLESKREYGAIFIRLAVGGHLVWGTQDNVFHYERMLEFRDFLKQYGFPYPLLMAHVSAYAQFICGLLYILGALVRPAAAVMVVNFLVALLVVHTRTPYAAAALAFQMLAGSLFLLFYGAGRPSFDQFLATRRRSAGRRAS